MESTKGLRRCYLYSFPLPHFRGSVIFPTTLPDTMDFTKIPGLLKSRGAKKTLPEAADEPTEAKISPFLTRQDTVLLENLLRDAANGNVEGDDKDDSEDYKLLHDLSDENSDRFEPQVFAGWDAKDLEKLPEPIQKYLLKPYIAWASGVVRRRTDIVFLTHILIYLSTSVPSAVYLYYNFTWLHGVCHYLMQLFYCGAFTLMLHNHIHNGGVLSSSWAWLDHTFPYILEPLMGHTWDSYFYHHVKHHHAEGNGPDDLSSTIRYQRDEISHFLHYVGRFLLFVWLELPLYFVRKGRYNMAVRAFVSEVSSYAFVVLMWRYQWRPTLFVLCMPLFTMRIGMMTGNWGQHAFVDDVEPDSAYRSSITLIDVPVSPLVVVSRSLEC
jgi:hypothetical protein